jgi:cell division protein ZapA
VKQIEVTIMGQSYVLGCPEGGEASLLEAVNAVDQEMSAIRDNGRVKARERIAVLAALNLAFALAQRPAADTTSKQVNGVTGLDSVDIDALIRRVDEALGDDGRLL